MSIIQPWLRNYNYINSYFSDIYNYYSQCYKPYPIVYYMLDKENTVWDDNQLIAGAYEKIGVGELSGVKWKKIIKLPINNLEQISPSTENSETGQNLTNSLFSSFSIPSSFGIKPSEWDFIDLNFAYNNNIINQNPLYVVTDLDFAHNGVYNQLYKCYIKVAPIQIHELEKQISSYYVFVDSISKIIPITNASIVYKLEQLYNNTKVILDNKYNKNSGFYFS